MDKRFVDEHQIVIRYFANRLSEPEEQAFIQYLCSHPQALDELVAVADLRLGLAALRNSSELMPLLKPRPWLGHRAWITAAAGVLIVVLTLVLGLRSALQPPVLAATSTLLDERGVPLPSGGIYSILRSRGASSETEIRIPSQPSSIELRVLPENLGAESHWLTLTFMDEMDAEREMVSLSGLRAGEDGFIRFHVASGALIPGRYRLTVENITAQGVVESASRFMIRATTGADSAVD